MVNYSMKCLISLMVWILAAPLIPLAWGARRIQLGPIRRSSFGLFIRLHPAIDSPRWIRECDHR